MSLRSYDFESDDAPNETADVADIQDAVSVIEHWLTEFIEDRDSSSGVRGRDPG